MDKEFYANLIVKAFKEQEYFAEKKEIERNIKDVENFQKEMIAKASMFDDETKALFVTDINDLVENRIDTMRTKNGEELTQEIIDRKNAEISNEYLHWSQENNIKDIAFEIESTYAGGTETIKNVIEKMNKNGADIEIVFEYKNQNKASGSYDSDIMVIMPSASFPEFSKEIEKDQDDSSKNVYGRRQECFFMNHVNYDLNIDTLKDDIKNVMENGLYGISSLNKRSALGYTELFGDNRNPEEKIFNAVNRYFSQIRNIEMEGLDNKGIYHETTNNLMTSCLVYNNEANPEYNKQNVTPLKEATRFIEKKQKQDLKNDVEPEQKQKKHRRIKPR